MANRPDIKKLTARLDAATGKKCRAIVAEITTPTTPIVTLLMACPPGVRCPTCEAARRRQAQRPPAPR